ncbi:MAG: hypothetical protein IT422_15105 [Pirellulaceae bacterium]|nr:hypothetical protein [Pirellulaceae bacterium]
MSLLKEEVGAIRIVANGVFGAQDPAAWISNFDESPSTRQLDFILKQDEWTVSCYRNFFYLPNFPEDGGDRSWQSADVVPSLFSALTGENLKTEVGSLTIAVLPYKNGFECESDFGERTREFEIFGAENETSAKTQNNERNLLVLIAGIDDRKDLLGNAKSILAVFGEDINSTEMPTLLRLSVLALYIDMLFAFSFKSDRLNATKSKWLSEEVCFIGNTNDFADSSCVAVLPAFLKERIAKIKEPSEVALSDVAAWHLIPGSNYIKSKDVTGNLMIFCDKVLPAGVCRDIREIHDFYLNVYQRFDDQGVSQFLQTKIEEHSIRARKAAIFARNFSHVTGSHVISNPLFAEKLFPDSNQLKGARDGLIRELQGFEKARKALTTHNWYDSPYQPLVNWESGLETEIDRLRNEPDLWPLKRFHQYLQGRFDFIARAVTETHDQPEPVFFISDLLDSFLEQTAFIDTFVADLGVPRDKMRFVVELPGASNDDVSATFMSVWAKGTPKTGDGPPLTHEWEFQKKGNDATSRRIEAYDFLVGLPGGTIAVHAFYSLLENIIRNSIKYQNAKQHYEITIRVESYKPSSGTNASDCKRFNISISDNYSKQKVGSDDFRGKIETILGTDLVVGQGKTETTSLGIQEMKLCAASLRADRVDPKEALKVPKTTDSEVLSYQFDLEQPVLLGLVSESEDATTAATLGFGSIVRSGTPDFFLTQNCHILVVDAAKAGELAEVLESHDQQRQLPYRILVLGKINGDGANLENWIANRRVVHVADMDFDSFIRQMLAEHSSEAQTPASDRSQPAKKLALDEQLVLTCYQTWLAGWKKHEQSKDGNRKLLPWLLCVGIDRETKQVKEAWQNSVDRFNDSKLSGDLVNTIIFATSADGRQQGQCVHKSPVERSIKWKYGTDQDRSRMLMFDNHGKCFGDIGEKSEKATNFRDSVRFYQQFGGQTPELFRLLSSPPQSEFGFAFFIYSILESCLANVAVVDERLAASLLFSKDEGGDTNTEFAKDLAAHQKAGIFPVFTFKQNDSHCTTNNTVNSTPTPAVLPSGHYKPVFQQAYDVICKNLQGGVEEGIRYCGSQVGAEAASFNMLANDGSNPVVLERDAADRKFDLIVIHEGALDILSKGGVQWEPDFVDHLYHIAPVVIRTSGRGRTTTGLPPTVPFIEFNIVSNAILTSRNKYGLVRGLLGSTGQEPEPKVR